MANGAGCGKEMEVSVPTRFSCKEIIVKCGDTSPHGDPWQCEECAEKNAGRNWRQEAVEAGETWGEDDY